MCGTLSSVARRHVLIGIVASLLVAGRVVAAADVRVERLRQQVVQLEARLADLRVAAGSAGTSAERAAAVEEQHRLERRLAALGEQLRLLDPASGGPSGEVAPWVETVTVTATKSALPSHRAAIPTEVITREEIEALATKDIESVLEAVPGILVRRNTPFTLGATTVSLQGAAPDQVAILLDGQPFSGGVDGVVDLRDVPVTNIERIEIVRGPGSALYGSQAMSGVINIITRQGESAASGDFAIGGGSFEQRLLQAAYGGGIGRGRYFLSAQGASYEPEEQWGDDFSSQLAPDDRQERGQAFLRVDVPFPTHDLHLSVNWLEEQNPNSSNRNPGLQARWNKRFGAGGELQLGASHYGYFRRNTTVGLEEQRDYDDQRAEARYQQALFGHPVWQNHLLTGGYRLRREALDSPALGAGAGPLVPAALDVAVDQHTLYLQDELFVGEHLSFVAAVGVDDHDRYGRESSPRVGVAWTPTRGRLSLSWGEGYRAPNLLQLFDKDVNIVAPGSPNPGYQILGNPDLRPERNRAWDAQADYAWRGVRGFVHGFVADYEELIATAFAGFNPTTFRYVNVAGARTAGVDLDLDLELTTLLGLPSRHGLDVGLGVGWLSTESESPLPTEDGQRLPFRPERTISPRIRYAHGGAGLDLSVWANGSSDQYTSLANVEVVEGHWVLHVKATQRIWKGLALFVEGHNVTNTRQTAHSTVDAGPPSVPPIVSPEAYLVGLNYSIGH